MKKPNSSGSPTIFKIFQWKNLHIKYKIINLHNADIEKKGVYIVAVWSILHGK